MACKDCFNCRVRVGIDWKPTVSGDKVIAPRGKISFNDSVKVCYCKAGRWIKDDGENDTISLAYVMGDNFKYNNERCPDFNG